MEDDGAKVDPQRAIDSQMLTGTFTGTFTGRFVASPVASPSPTPVPPSPSPAPPPVATQPPATSPPAGGASPTESPSGTAIPPATRIIDQYGHLWKVVDGVVWRNDTATPSSNVKMLLYHGGKVYQTNEAGGWWSWNVNQWAGAVDPRLPPAPTQAPPPTPAAGTVPDIPNPVRHVYDFLEVGKYWVFDNRWGSSGIQEGTAAHQYTQAIERSLTVSPEGAVAARIVWKWPQFDQSGAAIDHNPSYGEVKGYPCLIYGPPPGHYNAGQYSAGEFAVRAPDGKTVPTAPANAPGSTASQWQPQGGSVITRTPANGPPKGLLPLRVGMPSGALVANLKWAKNKVPTGRGHLAWDIWLQETPDQGQGFVNASLTHEIMIPIGNWGDYGRHPNGRNPGWYSHDVTIDGVIYHVYFAGSSGKQCTYTFGGLSGRFTNEETGQPRTGWKFIVFQHDGANHPTDDQGNIRLDLPKFFDHMATHKDSRGITLARGTEYCTNAQCGVEMVWGAGDITVYDFNITGR
jgi:hypothetical protein